jgi:predicted RNase H-like HicB family nuclease
MPETTKIRLDFNILVYREDNWWIAHCLEMDLPAEADTPQDAIKNLIGLIDVQIEAAMNEGDLQSIFSAAPPELWKAYAIATDRTMPRLSKRRVRPLNRVSVRELALC